MANNKGLQTEQPNQKKKSLGAFQIEPLGMKLNSIPLAKLVAQKKGN